MTAAQAPLTADGPISADPANLHDRVEDLLGRLTLEDKAGLMFQAMVPVETDCLPAHDGEPLRPGLMHDLVVNRHITHVNLMTAPDPATLARWKNAVDVLAARSHAGIPVTVSSDPRSAVAERAGASHSARHFSSWPEPVGIAAVRDPRLAARFGDAVRQEFGAVGIRMYLGPQVDIATEPRWARISGTWGGDPELTGTLGAAFISGLQGDRIGPESVGAMVKHFPGGGPQKDGEDPHFPHGKDQIYPGGHLDAHVQPFRAALAAGALAVMSYYGRPVGTDLEEVGFAFNRRVLTEMLRGELGFTGVISSDWVVLTDHEILGEPHQARAWGLEHLDPDSRALRALQAGTDQFGGEYQSDIVVRLVRAGRLRQERVDESVRRILTDKFRLGLFDQTPLDPGRAAATVGRADLVQAGFDAQRRSLTLLTNGPANTPVLPLAADLRIYCDSVDRELLAQYCTPVDRPADADLAILRLATPYEVRPGIFESFFHSGPLDFQPDRLAEILARLDATPTIVVINLERPAVLPEIAERATALVADYGSSDAAVLEVIFGRASPEGRLPFQLPRSMTDVLAGDLDEPHRFSDPLFDFGAGLEYAGVESA